MKDKIVLKPCPFCGEKTGRIVSRSVEVVSLDVPAMFEWCKVKCSTCGCSTDKAISVERAVQLWNKRAKDNSTTSEMPDFGHILSKLDDMAIALNNIDTTMNEHYNK